MNCKILGKSSILHKDDNIIRYQGRILGGKLEFVIVVVPIFVVFIVENLN
jgi:hypothetical protein